jgi:hypothetical protein
MRVEGITQQPDIITRCHLVGFCQECYWYLDEFGGSCRMVIWGPRQLDIARIATEVTMFASFSLKVEPTFGCALWKPKANPDD